MFRSGFRKPGRRSPELEGRIDEAAMIAHERAGRAGRQAVRGGRRGLPRGAGQCGAGGADPGQLARAAVRSGLLAAHRPAPDAGVRVARGGGCDRRAARHVGCASAPRRRQPILRQRERDPDHSGAGVAGVPHPAAGYDRHRAGPGGAVPLLASADRAQYPQRLDRHLAAAARVGAGPRVARRARACAWSSCRWRRARSSQVSRLRR